MTRASRLLVPSLAAVALHALCASPAPAQVPPAAVPLTPQGSPFDNVRGNWINFETSPIAPIVGDTGAGPYLFVVNQPAMRLAAFRLEEPPAPQQGLAQGLSVGTAAIAQPARPIDSVLATTFPQPGDDPAFEIAIGPGVVAVVPRPGSDELWLADSLTDTVGVVDVELRSIVRTIPLAGTEPHGIAFDDAGDRAWVSCSGSRSVDVIDTASYAVAHSVDVPALDPRGIVHAGGVVWVAPFLSGNNTTTLGTIGSQPTEVVEVTTDLGLEPLPDRDLLGIVPGPAPTDDALDPGLTVTGLGTVLFNLHARPGTDELWIPNTEGLNGVFRGEKNFPAGQVVLNRISIVDTTSQQVTVVDLDQTAPAGVNCAQPAAVAFSADGERAYVAGYGSDVIAVLDADAPASGWLGWYTVPGTDDGDPLTNDHSGPRGLWIDEAAQTLHVYNKADNSRSTIDLATASLAGGAAAAPDALGFDPTPADVKRGRMHLIDAGHSKSGTSSCASCHVDGHLDGLAWELSAFLDPEGTPSDQLQFEVDLKGPMITQSLRSLADSAPYHWRGERRMLEDFNGAFVGLLEREQGPLSDDDFADFEAYMLSLVYPSNPLQDPGRDYVGDQAAGQTIFTDVGSFGGQLECVRCHTLPTGSNGEIMLTPLTGIGTTAQVPQLRGLMTKLGELHDLGGSIGALRTEQGLGATHAGLFGTLKEGFLPNLTVLDDQQQDQIITFLEALDTGLAPATAWQATAAPRTPAEADAFIGTELAYLRSQLQAGHCDAVCYLQYESVLGTSVTLSLAWDHTADLFRLPKQGLMVTGASLVKFALARNGHATFLGLPLGSGWRRGIDQDYDLVLDLDEKVLGTDPLDPDTDGDGYTDGHEVAQAGMDPLVPDAGSTDTQPPGIVGSARQVFVKTNTVKIEFTTTEMAQARVHLGNVEVGSRSVGGYDVNHSVVVPGIPSGSMLTLTIDLTDVAGNKATRFFEFTSAMRTRPLVSRVKAIDMLGFDTVADTVTIAVTLSDQKGGTLKPEYEVEAFVYYADDVTPLTILESSVTALTNASDVATFVLQNVPLDGMPGTRRLHFGVRHVQKSGGFTYVEGEDLENFETYTF